MYSKLNIVTLASAVKRTELVCCGSPSILQREGDEDKAPFPGTVGLSDTHFGLVPLAVPKIVTEVPVFQSVIRYSGE